MILPASYSNGFAPRDGSPLYPELWSGCVGAWAPCLGPTGLTLRDWSGRANHGVLTNSPTWSPSYGKYAISLDGSNDYVTCGTAVPTITGSKLTVAAWFRFTTSISNSPIIARWAGSTFAYVLLVPSSPSNKMSFFINTTGGINGAISNNTYNDGKWHYAVGTYDGSAVRISVDETDNVSVSHSGTMVAASTEPVVFGNYSNFTGNYFPGEIDDLSISAAVNRHHFVNRRGIAYELTPRRRASSAVAFNRRRRLLVGAGS